METRKDRLTFSQEKKNHDLKPEKGFRRVCQYLLAPFTVTFIDIFQTAILKGHRFRRSFLYDYFHLTESITVAYRLSERQVALRGKSYQREDS